MKAALRARLRDARYAVPGLVEKLAPHRPPEWAAEHFIRLGRRGLRTTAGYFHGERQAPEDVARAWREFAEPLADAGLDTVLAIKANALACSSGIIAAIGEAGVPLVFDAMAPQHADEIVELARQMSAGMALPARWQRSTADAAALRDGPCRIRLVKGEWADPVSDVADPAAAFVELAATLAGRAAPVGVATHDPELAQAALEALVARGTPCELEQLRGLPRKRTTAVADRLGVPVRLYLPFGPGWWPYAVDRALARPHLPVWALRDALG